MTFEEWKEKHNDLIENVAITFFNYGRGVDTKTCYDELEYILKRAFNAGKDMNVPIKWHDLRKDPTDVPNENVTVLLLTEVEPVTARYDNEYEAFFRLSDKLNYCVFIAPMSYIAWCEIPEYTEE